jgi:hypothetical protein
MVPGPDYPRQFQSLRQIADKTLIAIGFLASQLVIQMEYGQAEVPARRQLEQHMEQAHRIGPAGDSHADSCPPLEHAITGDEIDHSLKHSPIVAWRLFLSRWLTADR